MGCPYFGSDDNALAYTCDAFALTAPANWNTRKAIEAAATEGTVTLDYAGNDRVAIDLLWDALTALPVYLWDGDATTYGLLQATLSNGDLTASVTLEAGLPAGKFYAAIPLDAATSESVRIDTEAESGSITVAIDNLPAATADNDPGGPEFSEAYALAIVFTQNDLATPWLVVTLERKGDGTLDLSANANSGAQSWSDEDATAPASLRVDYNPTTDTADVLLDDVVVLADVPYVKGETIFIPRFTVGENILTGGGGLVTCTMGTIDLPVVAAP